MAQDLIKKEALFNEVKGSLYEYLVAKELSILAKQELLFQKSLDRNYLTVLSQQDRMVRQFYPEMLPFLSNAAKALTIRLVEHLGKVPSTVRVVGKFSSSVRGPELHEADLLLEFSSGEGQAISLKLNKKNSFVNTKSGGIKSFFSQYFPYIDPTVQVEFNSFVDREFSRMALELHELHDLEFDGSFELWVKRGFSELPGELDEESRGILKRYYARIADRMHEIMSSALIENPGDFKSSLPSLLGFGAPEILQAIYFHSFPKDDDPLIEIHAYQEMASELSDIKILPFQSISSVELKIGAWELHIRVKPMNKFTTTAVKINCSVRFRRPNAS